MRLTLALLKRRLVRAPIGPPEWEIAEETKKFANLPEKYMQHCKRGVFWRTPRGINYRPKELRMFKNYIGLSRPWSTSAPEEIEESDHAPWIEPLRNWFFFLGDHVEVLVGKDKGKQGTVDMVIRERNWVIVKGLNGEIVPRRDNNSDKIRGYAFEERPLLVPTQVALIDPGDLLPTEVEWGWTEDGDKVRVSKRTGRIIPYSGRIKESYQYKSKGTYIENDKDTVASDMNVTFQPKLATFEMEIAEELGIKEDRIPKKTYWY